ncbi:MULTISPECIES: IclR family transcriptional regulator [Brevibacterium]|uniref:IclR family transcriptional regulator C-terminal domain-containing protein n=1 Tax=Brevibacterium salitolerans TaxID=1403566 RepID=A0ABN2WXR9_9MICO|nr:IclR family transcriptional regulator C-terminal domain-containing protein [Brevibacterium sp.]
MHDTAERPSPTADAQKASAPGTLQRAVAVIDAVAEGSSTAREISAATGLPLPTVYRITRELCEVEYLVHLREESRFALGYQLHRLAVRLHEDLGLDPQVRREIANLHAQTGMASYLALHRGADFVLVHVVDSPQAPRLRPMRFGFRENPHATAFGKLGLAAACAGGREDALEALPLRPLTPHTLTDPRALAAELQTVAEAGLAWEREEFQSGTACVAASFSSASGTLLGSVAVSAPVTAYRGQERHVEHLVRSAASRAGRIYRLGRD